MKNRCNYISLILLLPIVLIYQFVQLANVHYHLLANGSIIKHSHTYVKKSQNNSSKPLNHTHTSREFLFLSSFDGAADDNIGFQFQVLVKDFEFEAELLFYSFDYLNRSKTCYGLRGPPQLV